MSAEAHALHTATKCGVADDRHRNSPILRTSAPSGRVGTQSSSERMYASGKSHSRAAAITNSI